MWPVQIRHQRSLPGANRRNCWEQAGEFHVQLAVMFSGTRIVGPLPDAEVTPCSTTTQSRVSPLRLVQVFHRLAGSNTIQTLGGTVA